jgi:peptidoglycan/LPS O-acetylase OafA/YrhL
MGMSRTPPLCRTKSIFMGPSPAFQISPFQSSLLDLSRWVAALLVVLEHLRCLMFVDYGAVGSMGPAGRIFYYLTGFGHEAVMVFFVMSGFLVGGRALERLGRQTFSWQKYLVDRASRLYAVYALALLLGGALDYWGYHSFNRFGLYDLGFQGRIPVIGQDVYQNLSGRTLALNLAMCQTVLAPVYGSNGPLWSLANEAWYYLAGPALFSLLLARGRWKWLANVAVLAGLFWFLPSDILIYFLVWLMGAALYFFNARPRLRLVYCLPLFLGAFGAARLHWLGFPVVEDFLIGITFALVIHSAAGNARQLAWHKLSRRAADFSYSVYLCHFPFLLFMLSAWYQVWGTGLRSRPAIGLAGLYVLMLILSYGWCYLISLVSERQTSRIRGWFYRRLGLESLLKAGIAR